MERVGRSPSPGGGGRAVRGAPAMAEAGGGGEEGVRESSTPRRAPAPAPAASDGSGRGGGGVAGGRNVCGEVFERLLADGHVEAVGASGPELRARLEAHFPRLPTSYQLDVNVVKAEDVLIHQKVKCPAISIRFLRLEGVNVDETTNSDALEEGDDIGEALSTRSKKYTYIHEMLFFTTDKPKLLSQLPALLSDIGLNIREAHVFSTTDGYSLDVFVVDGWPFEDTGGLHKALEALILRNEIPYNSMSPLQAAVGVRQGLRPQLPENAHPRLLNLMQRCWEALPSDRPTFTDVITELEDIQAQPQGTSIPSSLPDRSPLQEIGPPPKFHVDCGGGGSMVQMPAQAVRALPRVLEEIDWTPKIQVGGGGSARAGALERTDALIKEVVSALPPPPDRCIWFNGALPDNDDPVALALDQRGIHPDDRYDPYFDLYMYSRPLKEEQLRAGMKFPLKLHDAGLVEAERCIITWGPGLSGRRVDFTVQMTKILELHQGPVACLRLDETAFPAPEHLRRWLDILTAKEVEQFILLNLTQPEDTEALLHHLRSRRLTYLAIGFVNIRACLRLAMEAAHLDTHPWTSLKGVTLTGCAFDGPDLSRTISNLGSLKNLSIQFCTLTIACSEDGLQIESGSLVTLQLLSCTADHKVTIGPAPVLTHLTLGVVPAPKAAAAPPSPLYIKIVYCNSLRILDQLDLQKQAIALTSKHKMKVHFRVLPTLRFLHTLALAVEMATTHHGSLLVDFLSCFPFLKVLTVQRVDDGTSDGVCPHVDSIPCLANYLQHLTMQQFRGGAVEVMFVVDVLDVALNLSTLTVEWHPTPPHKPEDATSSARPHPTTTMLHWQDAVSYFHRCRRAARQCDIIVVPPTSDKV